MNNAELANQMAASYDTSFVNETGLGVAHLTHHTEAPLTKAEAEELSRDLRKSGIHSEVFSTGRGRTTSWVWVTL